MLGDLVIADVAEAEAVVQSAAPSPRWPALDGKGIDMIKLSSLALLMAGKTLDSRMVVQYSRSFTSLAAAGEVGPWLFLVPPGLTSSLSELSDSEVPKVANAWLQTDELRADRWELETVLLFLREFRKLAGISVTAGKPILLRIAL